MKANPILPCSAARQITSSTDIASWDAFTAHRSFLDLTTWRHDVVCCSGVTEYNSAVTLQWSTSGMFLAKMLRYFILQFLDSHGIPNDITLVLTMKLLSPRVIQPCNPEKYCTLGLHPWQRQKYAQKSANKVIRPNWNGIQWCTNGKLLS
jgi:hypothetical protein